jgi:ABC-type histidine transport system ATPase subunit
LKKFKELREKKLKFGKLKKEDKKNNKRIRTKITKFMSYNIIHHK